MNGLVLLLTSYYCHTCAGYSYHGNTVLGPHSCTHTLIAQCRNAVTMTITLTLNFLCYYGSLTIYSEFITTIYH